MRILARKDACAGHARCAAVAPDIFELDDDGYIAFTEKLLPPGHADQAKRGARACPERVLKIEQE